MQDLAGLFNWLGKPAGFSAAGEYFETEEPPDRSLIQVLGIHSDTLKPLTLEMLESLKETDFIRSLKGGYRAFFEFQDIFPLTIKAKDVDRLDAAHLVNRDYCYYEALAYLRASITAALDKNPVAAMTLLRPFLELSVLHLFWLTRSETEGYDAYYKWLDGRHEKPGFSRQVEQVIKKVSAGSVIPQDRLKRLKQTILKLYTGLCKYNHGPKMSDSMAALSRAQTGMSLDSFYLYLATVDLLMSQIIYIYILAYPMILFPVERMKKWGVSGPIGIYVESNTFAILKCYLGKNSVEALRKSLSTSPRVRHLLDAFDNQPELSEDEQEKEWNDFVKQLETKDNPSEWPARIAMNRSYYRTLRWFLNYVRSNSAEEELDHHEIREMFESAKSW